MAAPVGHSLDMLLLTNKMAEGFTSFPPILAILGGGARSTSL